jgi:2-polyprenyl-3-methyl-5-hydroxy-6-metoxy-1,4-benzoquinol methylase
MSECCGPGAARYEDMFDDRFAQSVARRYRRRGLTKVERDIVDHLGASGLAGRTVLEIGGGVGEIQLELLRRGAAHTTNLELSSAYEREASTLLAENGLQGRASRIVGIDVAVDGDRVAPADYVVLHRVVCCYPHAARLLEAAASHARLGLVFSHPPRTRLTRALLAVDNAWTRLRRREYRGYVHPPEDMYAVLNGAELTTTALRRRPIWWVVAATRA